jgi:glycosyltransferase involved in cell wall biosynthesis
VSDPPYAASGLDGPLNSPAAPGSDALELSIVLPCLNEAETLGTCLSKALGVLRDHRISGEVIVADNGSSDGSQAIAAALGARVVSVTARGYGNALMGGIAAARGNFVVMGDADDSYDFLEVPKFVAKLREGYDIVQGCRLPSGGGTVALGAMPFLHRVVGNPMFSAMARRWFHAPIHDVYCGMRGFRRDFYLGLGQRCTGMEFANEMIIKASLTGGKVAEVPITLHPDGRRAHAPHLRTFRDGWRTLRFYLLYSPRRLFLIPGLLLIALGIVGYGIALPGLRIGRVHFDVDTLLFASLAVICGYQSVVFAVCTKVFAIAEGLLPMDRRMERAFHLINLETGLITGAVAMVLGVGLLGYAINLWRVQAFGDLDYSLTMRWVIPGVTLTALGFQTILSSFFLSVLGLRRR